MNINETRSAVEYLDACLRDIAERGLAEEQPEFDAGLVLRDDLVKTIERHEQIARLSGLPSARRDSPACLAYLPGMGRHSRAPLLPLPLRGWRGAPR